MPRLSTPDVGSAATRLTLRGELDLSTRDSVCEKVAAALRSHPSTIALDLSGVTFIDCAGLCGILQAHGLAAERNCHLMVAEMSAPARRLLSLTETLAAFTQWSAM